jgi:hypothetical protein
MMRGETGLTSSPCSPNFSRFSDSLHPLHLHDALLLHLHEALLHPLHEVLLRPLHVVLLPRRQRQTPTILKSGDGIKSNLYVGGKT